MTVAYETSPFLLASGLFAIQLETFSLSICFVVLMRAFP